jgi:hypothetical protein
MTKAVKHFWIGFKNAFDENVSDIRKEHRIKNIWDISDKIEKKYQKINVKTSKNIQQHIRY